MATRPDLSQLKRRGLSVLRFAAEEWEDIRSGRRQGARFTLAFPHDIARCAKTRSPVLIVIAAGDGPANWRSPDPTPPELKLGWIKSIMTITTRDTRVSFDHIHDIKPDALDTLCRNPPAAIRKYVESVVDSGDEFTAFSPKAGEWVLDRVAGKDANHLALRRLAKLLQAERRFDNAVALQEDALTLALRAFGATDAAVSRLVTTGATTALENARLREDAVIEHDARWIPGWNLDDSDLTGRAVFRRGRETLEVFTANKQPLEALFGVDLIYLNLRRRAIVMVQYKIMEEQERPARRRSFDMLDGAEYREPEWIVRLDDQFRDEVERMERFATEADPSGAYRMSTNPFFFKLVKRHGDTKSPGILMSLDHLNHLRTAGELTGERGGLRISYGALDGHYLRGETFVELVRSGYVGTHCATTDHMEALIMATLAGGRAAVAAIQHALDGDALDD